jgi:hypothetical protein
MKQTNINKINEKTMGKTKQNGILKGDQRS